MAGKITTATGGPMTDYGGINADHLRFGRFTEHDEASRAYGITQHIHDTYGADATRQPRSYRWNPVDPCPLNQGQTTECVAFAWTHDLITPPVQVIDLTATTAPAYAHRLYREMRQTDRLPAGTQGTSVLAGAKVMKRHGHISAYRWAFTEPELAAGVAWQGPAIVGIPWTTGMMHPTRTGFLEPTGQDLGGHAILVFGVDVTDGHYYVMSSWGPRWGKNGRAKIRRATMAERLVRRGDACLPIRTEKTTR